MDALQKLILRLLGWLLELSQLSMTTGVAAIPGTCPGRRSGILSKATLYSLPVGCQCSRQSKHGHI